MLIGAVCVMLVVLRSLMVVVRSVSCAGLSCYEVVLLVSLVVAGCECSWWSVIVVG